MFRVVIERAHDAGGHVKAKGNQVRELLQLVVIGCWNVAPQVVETEADTSGVYPKNSQGKLQSNRFTQTIGDTALIRRCPGAGQYRTVT